MLDLLIDNMFVVFVGHAFQQTIGIPMGTNCAPLLADYFLHAYDADFLQWLLANRPGTLTTLGTHDTGRRQTKHKNETS